MSLDEFRPCPNMSQDPSAIGVRNFIAISFHPDFVGVISPRSLTCEPHTPILLKNFFKRPFSTDPAPHNPLPSKSSPSCGSIGFAEPGPGHELQSQMKIWGERMSGDRVYLEALDVFLLAFTKKIPLSIYVYCEGMGL